MAGEMTPMTNQDCLRASVMMAAIWFAAVAAVCQPILQVRGSAGVEFRGKLVFIFVEFSSRVLS
jgi:hypothetical protein